MNGLVFSDVLPVPSLTPVELHIRCCGLGDHMNVVETLQAEHTELTAKLNEMDERIRTERPKSLRKFHS